MNEVTSPRPAQVVYLCGLGRSGSTLIERLLGELPGVCAAGEVVHLWERGLLAGERCGCGEPLLGCQFWRQVGETAFGGWDQVDVPRLRRLQQRVDRTRFLPLLAAPRRPAAFEAALTEYVSCYQRLYAAIEQVSGCPIVVDSSKLVSRAFCLQWCDGIDLRVVQVVRDSRAVAYSWTRQVSRPDSMTPSLMRRYPPASASLRWDLQNGALHLLAARGTPTLRVRYEDVTAAPEATLRKIAEFVGAPGGGDLGFIGGPDGRRWADLTPAHTASGNPMRFQTGRIALRRDDEWRREMPTSQRYTVTILTYPLLARYGYLRDGSGGPPGPRENGERAVGQLGMSGT